jgi:hypothetical protein
MGSRTIEHQNSRSLGIARRSSRAKPDGASSTHPQMASRTNTTLGAPPRGTPLDASSPSPTAPEKQQGDKTLPVPAVTFGMKSDPQRGSYDPSFAEHIMGEATRSSDDYARNLHATLPRAVTEE